MKRFVFIFVFIFTISGIFAQQNPAVAKLNTFVQNIDVFNRLYPQEKVYLHFDNTGYFLGETIWFKAYIVTAEQNEPSTLSRILYVELLTPAGKIVDNRKLKIENGQCHGEFKLEYGLLSGYYEVRAYTRYMLNFGEECIFSRIFPVLNSDDLKDIEETGREKIDNRSPFLHLMRKKPENKKDKVNLAFYPEGGNLITGLSTRIAFKATDENGQGIAVFGVLKNSNGEEIASLQTVHKGMGVFELPAADNHKKYSVEIQYEGKKHKFDLPSALSSGYTMNIFRQNEDGINVLIQKSEKLPSNSLGLSITCRGKVYLFETTGLSESKLSVKIPTNDLPSGVNRLTLFDAKGEILSDRLFFVNKADWGQIIVNTDKETYEPFEKVNMSFQVQNNKGEAEETTFSLSVRDAGTMPDENYMDNIRTNLLLSSDLKGYIESPGWYFEKADKEQTIALDLLLMVQGWHRYSWKYSTGLEPFNPPHYVEKEILIKGKILSFDKKKQACPDILVTVEIPWNACSFCRKLPSPPKDFVPT